jgi:Skp family chaperone for outer membrane proteins
MSTRWLLPVLLLSGVLSGYAQAPAAATAMPRKMAVIDFDRAVLGNNEGIKARGQLESRMRYWQDQEDSLTKDRKALTDKQVTALTDREKTDLVKDLSSLDLKIRRNREDASKDIESRRTTLFTSIADRVKRVLKEYGDEQNLAAVINDTPAMPGSVIFRSDVADITSEIIRRVNADIEKNPNKAPATPAPAK